MPATKTKPLPRQVGAEIRKARDDAGLSQAELASKVGLSQPTLSGIENDKDSARVATLNLLALVLGKPVSTFLRTHIAKDAA